MASKLGGTYKNAGLRQGVGLVLETRAALRAARARFWGDARESLFSVYGEIGSLIDRAAGQGKDRRARAASLTATLGRALGRLYGPAFREERLALMLRFAECYPKGADRRALKALRWRQVVPLLALESAKERAAFADSCARDSWSPERLRAELALRGRSRTPFLAVADRGKRLDEHEPDPDPDCAEFLGCSNADLGWREVLVRSLETYLLNLEAGFCLVERNRRFQIGDDDFSLDLVFFHRPLKRLFAIACRVEAHPLPGPDPLPLTLLWLEQNERQPGENPPVGLLLDASAGPDSLVLRDLDHKPLPWYRSGLPPRSVLRAFFLRSLASAREDAAAEMG